MDQNSGVLECRLDFAGAVHNGVAVEILFRLFADHLEMVAKVTTGSEVAEHQLIATEPGAVIPYLANFFPVTSVQIARRRVSVRGSGKRVLKELSLP